MLDAIFDILQHRENVKCELLGPFAILVQSSLGALAILSLFYKRYIERPRRPLKIWLFDVSKQIFGAVMVHFLNIAMSADDSPSLLDQYTSPCTWYFLNVLLDTTIGVGLIWIFLEALASTSRLLHLEGCQSGNYGSPPRYLWWFKQAVLYSFGLSLMKLDVFIILTTVPQLSVLGNFLLKWSEHHEKSRIVFVMFLFPLIMNIIQYVVIDNIVMSHDSRSSIPEGDAPTASTSCPANGTPAHSSINATQRISNKSNEQLVHPAQ